jgi:UDP-glucose 4-epimerase
MRTINCLITGGAGFIGSTIADMLLNEGFNVTILDNLSTGQKTNINPRATFYECDLNLESQEQINTYFQNINYVFHCAALPNVQFSIEYPKEANDANVNSTIKTLVACVANKVDKIIYSGSCSAYGNANTIPTAENETIAPLSPYALQKYIAEEYCELYHRMYNLSYVILRYFNVYGERMTDKGAYVSVLSHFLRSYKNNTPLNITNTGEQKRDFVYVKDVARANIAAMLNDSCNNQIFNIGCGTNHSVNTLASVFNRPIQYGESRIEPFETLANIEKAKNILNWSPEVDTIDWIKQTLKDI